MGSFEWKKCESPHIPTFFKKLGGRYKRIRKRPKGKPAEAIYERKLEKLLELKRLANGHKIELFYGGESHVCTEGYVPYGWQFPGEQVCILSERSARMNCFAMINRKSECFQFTTQENMDAQKVMEFLEDFSLKIRKETFLVLDNASVHRAQCIQERIPFWQKRGFFLFYLPPYSPHLNIAETIWRMLKGQWIKPEDYIEKQQLFYATKKALAALGNNLFINFKHIDN